jgi:hypothetical protein
VCKYKNIFKAQLLADSKILSEQKIIFIKQYGIEELHYCLLYLCWIAKYAKPGCLVVFTDESNISKTDGYINNLYSQEIP